MLSLKDKEWISEEITRQLKGFLEFEVTVEKGPRKQGDPGKVVEKEIVNGIAFILRYFPMIEGAIRGVQADVDKAKNKVFKQNDLIRSVAQTLITMEGSAKTLASLSDKVKQPLTFNINAIDVESFQKHLKNNPKPLIPPTNESDS